MNILNKNLTIEKIDYPYTIWIIDNFLKKDVIDNILNIWPDYELDVWHKGHQSINGKVNILEHGMRGISDITKMPVYIADIIKYFHSTEFTKKIEDLLNVQNLIPDEAMRWSGMRVMIPGSYQLIHSDARKSPESGLRKELTCLLYLNDNYEVNRDKGCLEVWNDEMTECVHSIEPILNRMTVFLNSDTSYHGVPEVVSERRAITFSILTDGADSARSKALFVPRPFDGDEIKIEGVSRSLITDSK